MSFTGVDRRRFTAVAPPFRFQIGVLANLNRVKRIYEMVRTVKALKQRGFAPHLRVAGGKSADRHFDRYHAAIVRLIEQLDLTADVVLEEYVEDTPAWLQGIDIFVSNSFWEGQSVALLEAMASGCLCLCHFWDGADEVLPVESLYLTEDDLQRKLLELASTTEDVRRRLRRQMRLIAEERFDLARQKLAIRKVIDDTFPA